MRRQGRVTLRVAALVCAAGAAVSAVGAIGRDDAGASTSIAATPTARTPVWSPRRVPRLFVEQAEQKLRERTYGALTERLAAIVAPYDACVAVDVDGQPAVRVGADRALAPASTLKTVTAFTALASLGPDHRFTTRVVTDDAHDLVVVGGGDPLLATAAYIAHRHGEFEYRDAPFTPLDRLADAIVAAGVRHVSGALVVDDSAHDTLRYLPHWKSYYGHDGEVGALGALTVDGGFADPVRQIPAADPATLTGVRLAEALAARGVTITGGLRRGRATGTEREVAHVDSLPVADIVREMLRASDNYTAEELLRDLAMDVAHHRAGTTDGGNAVVQRVLASNGVPTDGFDVHDGSGLAPDDRVRCETLVGVIELAGTPRFAALGAALAVAGESGTLAERFRDDPLEGRLHAKTGTLTGVTGLTGVVDAGARPRFAFLASGGFSTATGQDLQVAVVEAVASAPAIRAPAGLVPVP